MVFRTEGVQCRCAWGIHCTKCTSDVDIGLIDAHYQETDTTDSYLFANELLFFWEYDISKTRRQNTYLSVGINVPLINAATMSNLNMLYSLEPRLLTFNRSCSIDLSTRNASGIAERIFNIGNVFRKGFPYFDRILGGEIDRFVLGLSFIYHRSRAWYDGIYIVC